MGDWKTLKRRDLLGGVSVATVTAAAGCPSGPLGGGGSMTWQEAFMDGTSTDDRSVLDPTPVAVAEVSSQAEVETALAVLGWNLSVTAESGLVGDLETAASVAADLRPAVTEVIGLLTDGLELVQEMKETSALGTSVWDVAVASAPSLEGFVELARALKDRLERQRDRLRELADATDAVITHLRSIRANGTTEYGDLPGAVEAARSLYRDVVADVDTIRADVQQVIELSAEARAAAGELPVMGRQVARVFDAINQAARELDQRLAAFRSEVAAITDAISGVVAGAAAEANQRYGPISQKATGSAGEMGVMSIRTDVTAYGAVAAGGGDTPTAPDDLTPTDGAGDPAATTGPQPTLDSVSIPDTVDQGQRFRVMVTVTNEGERAGPWSTISVSFPGLRDSDDHQQVSIRSMTSSDFSGVAAPGREIKAKSGATITAEYVLAEGGTDGDGYWAGGETRTLSLAVEAESTGSFPVLVRSTMTNPDDVADKVTAPSADEASAIDQQDYPVNAYTVKVRS